MILLDKTIIVTGASRGIGKSIAELFASEGACLILLGRSMPALELVKNGLDVKFTDKSKYHVCIEIEISDRESIKSSIKKIASLQWQIDCLVNNAGIMIDAPLMLMRSEDLDNLFEVNTVGVILITQNILKMMARNKKGSIINLTSIIGTNGAKGQSVYSATKSAIIGFTKSLSKELASLNIRVNAIAPGFIQTDMTSGKSELFYDKSLKSIGIGRFGVPRDVAELATFLASDKSTYITGQIIGVDGGMVI
jgi:3-oxoacyl-[acyl-carrier protein] reductase